MNKRVIIIIVIIIIIIIIIITIIIIIIMMMMMMMILNLRMKTFRYFRVPWLTGLFNIFLSVLIFDLMLGIHA